jgi:hypothetical protein
MSDILELSRSYLKANAAETGADVLIEELGKEVVRLRNILRTPLSSAELKLVDKHCEWGPFMHAWNAVIKNRVDAAGQPSQVRGNGP